MEEQQEKITKDANIGAVVFKYPEVEEILQDYGLHCGACMAAGFDTIEMGAQVHNLSAEEIDEMVERINEVVFHGE